MQDHEIDCPFREEIGGYRALLPLLVKEVDILKATVSDHDKALAGLKVWTALAAALAAAAGSLIGGGLLMFLGRVWGH